MTTPPSIKILRPGTFTDIHGTRVTFTALHLAEIAASYDAVDPAPLVLGHPKHDDPAQGWVGSLRVENDVLVADPDQVAPEFAEMVKAGRYKRISPSLYPPKDPANPTPGKWRLKHVGFLGAMAPAIKGLGTVSFSEEADAASVTIELTEEQIMTDTTDATAIDPAEREAALAAREEAVAAREEKLATEAAAAAHTANVSFAETLVEGMKLAPAGKDKVVGLLDQLGEVTQPLSFGEGDAAEQMTALDAFKSLFDGAHPVVAFGEHAAAEQGGAGATVTVSFASPPGFTLQADQNALHSRAKQIQSANPGMQFWDAFNQARTEVAG